MSWDPFYPVVDSSDWVRRMVGAGARFVQLRIKDIDEATLYGEIRTALDICEEAGASLVVNDYWQIAIEEEAEWLHLGQEDLDDADVAAIKSAGIRFGVSTHDHTELERALTVEPDYIALGPVWPTILKAMRFDPQGLDRIREWKELIGEIPLVAIGGITLERAPSCLEHGADIVGVVNDIVRNPDPEAHARAWIAATRRPEPVE